MGDSITRKDIYLLTEAIRDLTKAIRELKIKEKEGAIEITEEEKRSLGVIK